MYRVFTCLASEHNIWLVLLAALVCISTTLTTFKIYSIATVSHDYRKLPWIALAGLCAGTGIWATHFVAMLAYSGNFPTAFEPVSTLSSLMFAIVFATVGFALSCREDFAATLGGGVIVGASIGIMHSMGMHALLVPGTLSWDLELVAVSWIGGIALAAGSLVAFKNLGGSKGLVYGAAILTVAICVLHFTSMGAVSIIPDPTVPFQPSVLNRPLLAMATAGVTFIVLFAALAADFMQRANTRFENTLREQNARFEAALHYLPIGFSMFDEAHRLILCNRKYRDVYELSEDETRPGTKFTQIMAKYVSRDGNTVAEDELAKQSEWLRRHNAKLAEGKAFGHTQTLTDGRIIRVRVGPVDQGGWVDVQEDITERSRQDAKIEYMARHDMLTGLPNRAELNERLANALSSNAAGEHVAVLFLDLDRFKDVNDTLGHRVGDALLIEVAKRLRRCVRPTDVLARVGGDEFVVVLVSDQATSVASTVAARIIKTVGTPYEFDGQKLAIGTSVGIGISDDRQIDSQGLLARADLALYRAKTDGRGTYCLFEDDMDRHVRQRREIERDLKAALERGEFELYYQPLLNFETNQISGFEALMRWHHPERGLVSPAEFIPVAEDTGLIIPLGEWALRQACAQAATWPSHIKVAVNLSPAQFKCQALTQAVLGAIAYSGLRPHQLELEITETALLHNSEKTLATLHSLRNFGVRIALDDFGTGYSSLSYLRSFPFNKIKIDRSFVSSLPNDENSAAIVRAVCDLARALNLSVTAEGVETKEQFDYVKLEGCTEMQGYYFSRPVAVTKLQEFFEPTEEAQVA